jgi:hypothetical protein
MFHPGQWSVVTGALVAGQPASSKVVAELGGASQRLLCLPFDIARATYAKSVQLGLVEQSMIAGAKFERDLASLELVTLGPWARRV